MADVHTLHDDATGGPRRFALHLQRRAGKLGVLLQACDGGGERYMLSDAVSGLELGEDDFVGRVRGRTRAPRRGGPAGRLSERSPALLCEMVDV
jgi:hypothetical protein